MSANTALSDSVDTYLDWANQDTLNYEDRLKFNRRAMDILRSGENDSLNRVRTSDVAIGFYNLGYWQDFKKSLDLLYEMSYYASDSLEIAKALRFKAEYYKQIGKGDSSFYYFLKAEKLYNILDSKQDLAKTLLNKGIVQYYANDYFGAELSVTKSYSLLVNSDEKDEDKVYQALSMIGIISNDLKEYDRAIEYHNKAYEYAKINKLNDVRNQEANSLNNIGNVYQNLGDNNRATEYFQLALKNRSNLIRDFPALYAMLIDNLAYSKFKMGDYSNLPNLYYQSLSIRDSLKLTSDATYSRIHLAEYFAFSQDTLHAIKYSLDAYNLAVESKSPNAVLAALQQLSLLDHTRASTYTLKYIKISDSLQLAERYSKDKFARIQFETDEISLEKDKLAAQNRNLFLFFGATVMIGLLLFVIRSQRARNRELLLKQAQQKANEDIYNLMLSQQNKIEEGRIKEKKRIAQELHDGVLGRLFGARLNLDSLNKVDGTAAEEKRNNYLAELKNIEQDIREISHDLNREKFVLINNFVAILNNLLEEQATSYPAKVNSNIDGKIKWKHINNTLKITLYRVTQEALQNINKYANASVIVIDIKQINNNLSLTVSDNGSGFDTDKKSKGIGIQNMLTRTHECNGTFEISSEKGRGTTISIHLPIKSKAEIEEFSYPQSTNITV